MTAPLHTRCPQCQTIFHVTPAQLEARAGLVRCGICAGAFQADRNLIETLPNNRNPARASATDEIARTDPIERAVTGQPDSPADDSMDGGGTTPGTAEVEQRRERLPRAASGTAADDLPLMNEFPLASKHRRTPTAMWLLGGVLLLVLLAAQVAYFYAPQLARDARLKPWLALYCERAGCDLRPLRGTLPIDLVETAVAPHPRYENALRLSAVLVNRAEQVQPYPVMEVSLTDSEGQVLARRSFAPAQYLESPASHGALAPNIAVRARLDVTNADGRAIGYEIRLVAAVE
ncbi:MAG: DUF3426 domain-containing protein [Gammaproteobacteria bacterium]|nr:DUF3426 domain-containing protein [Gammaproteobacteria bacterium]